MLFQNLMSKLKANDRKTTNIIVLLIVAVIVMITASGFGSNKKETKHSNLQEPKIPQAISYVETLEKRLENVLSEIKGAGTVKVMLTMKNAGEKILAKDTKLSEQNETSKDSNGGNKNSNSITKDDKIIVKPSTDDQPIIIKEIFPKVLGVLVTCDGAEDKTVKDELHDAVKAVLEVPAHRIKIVSREKDFK